MDVGDFLSFVGRHSAYVLPVFFVVIWVIVVKFLSMASGWKALAEKYPLHTPFSGGTHRFQSARMRWGMNFNNCLTIGANHMGLYLSMFFLFRIGHDPIFVPWSDVQVSVEEGRFTDFIRLSFSRSPDKWLKISRKLFEKLERDSGASFRKATPRGAAER